MNSLDDIIDFRPWNLGDNLELLVREIAVIEELLEIEPESKCRCND